MSEKATAAECGNVGEVVSMAYKALSPKMQENVQRALGWLHEFAQQDRYPLSYREVVVSIAYADAEAYPNDPTPTIAPKTAYEFFEGAKAIWDVDPEMQLRYPKAEEGMDILSKLEDVGKVRYTVK